MSFRVSPGVYPNIIDESLDSIYTSPNIAATVFGHTRGPLGPFLTTSIRNRQLRYGLNNPSWGHGIDSTDAFLLQGTRIWTDRVVSADAVYGLGLICNNKVAGVASGTSYTPIPGGSNVPYGQLNRTVVDLEYVGTFATGNSTIVTINGTATTSVVYNTSHNVTMAVVCQAIQNVLDGLEAGGYAWLVPVGTNDQVIRIISPQAITLAVSATATGTNAPTVSSRAADWMCFVVAQNPGSWSNPTNQWGYNGVAVGISNVDVGVSQRTQLGFSTAILAGQTVSITINGTVIATPFAVNNNQTLINMCANIQNAIAGSTATVTTSASSSNNLVIQLVAPSPDTNLTITAFTVTGTMPLATCTFAVTLNPVASNSTFNFVVYENPNFVQPDELYLCTYANGTDGLGNPTGLDYVVNGVNSLTNTTPLVSPSPRVSLTINPLFSGMVNGATSVTNSNYPRYLGGGADGSIPSTQQIVTGWNDFANPEAITIRLLINGGYASAPVHQIMMSTAASRQDCFCVLDTPSNLQAPEDAANYRQNVMAVNSFWGAIYSPDILIYDATTGSRRYVPPSGMVAAQYAYNDRVASEFFAPAGLTRGVLQNALGCRYTYEEGDRDELSSAQVNAIRFINGAWTIWGEYTLQYAMSSLSSVPVVRMVITVITEAASTVAKAVFEPNNPYTWHRVTSNLNGILQPIEDAQGITDFTVQCNAANNTPDIIQQRVMKVAMYIKPVLCALYIQLDAIITRQDAVFAVSESNDNNSF